MYLESSNLDGLGFGVKSVVKKLKKTVKKVTKPAAFIAKPLMKPAALVARPLMIPAKLVKKAPPFAAKLVIAAPRALMKAASKPVARLITPAAAPLMRAPIISRGKPFAARVKKWSSAKPLVLSPAQRQTVVTTAAQQAAPAAVVAAQQAAGPAAPAPVVAERAAEVVRESMARQGVDVGTPEAEEAVEQAVKEEQEKPKTQWGRFVLPAAGIALMLLGKG